MKQSHPLEAYRGKILEDWTAGIPVQRIAQHLKESGCPMGRESVRLWVYQQVENRSFPTRASSRRGRPRKSVQSAPSIGLLFHADRADIGILLAAMIIPHPKNPCFCPEELKRIGMRIDDRGEFDWQESAKSLGRSRILALGDMDCFYLATFAEETRIGDDWNSKRISKVIDFALKLKAMLLDLLD